LRRIANTEANDRSDFFGHLLKDKNASKDPEFYLINASTIITAGSETTATFLAATTYFLLRNPKMLQALQTEIRGAFSNSADITQDSTAHLEYLSAVIQEGLRMFPPVSFGLQRVCPGAIVDGVYIPQGTTVSTATYTVSHSERYFHDSQKFHPERWLSSSHPLYDDSFSNDEKDASKPFSLGPRSCLGINLAYLEMRITISKLVWHYDWELKSKDIDWVRDTGMHMLWRKPSVMVKFTPVVKN